jgi:hypothetical protein
MKYLDRLLAKKQECLPVGTDRNDKNPPSILGSAYKESLTETTKTVSVVFVSTPPSTLPNIEPPKLIPSSWRDCIAVWPIEWREKWGRLANALEDEGQVFPRSEFEAFGRIKKEMDAS